MKTANQEGPQEEPTHYCKTRPQLSTWRAKEGVRSGKESQLRRDSEMKSRGGQLADNAQAIVTKEQRDPATEA